MIKHSEDLSASDQKLSLGNWHVYTVNHSFVPFIVELQCVFPIQWSHELSDHSLRLLPLIPPQHSDVSHQPGHRTDGHTAHLSLNVVSDFLHSEDDNIK